MRKVKSRNRTWRIEIDRSSAFCMRQSIALFSRRARFLIAGAPDALKVTQGLAQHAKCKVFF